MHACIHAQSIVPIQSLPETVGKRYSKFKQWRGLEYRNMPEKIELEQQLYVVLSL